MMQNKPSGGGPKSGGNKMKDEFTTYMSKKQAATDFAPGTEEMNPDDLEQLSEVENQ